MDYRLLPDWYFGPDKSIGHAYRAPDKGGRGSTVSAKGFKLHAKHKEIRLLGHKLLSCILLIRPHHHYAAIFANSLLPIMYFDFYKESRGLSLDLVTTKSN